MYKTCTFEECIPIIDAFIQTEKQKLERKHSLIEIIKGCNGAQWMDATLVLPICDQYVQTGKGSFESCVEHIKTHIHNEQAKIERTAKIQQVVDKIVEMAPVSWRDRLMSLSTTVEYIGGKITFDKANKTILEVVETWTNRDLRKSDLEKRLKEHGLFLRNDSQLCSWYVEGGIEYLNKMYKSEELTVESLVEIMVEMDFLFSKTNYNGIFRNLSYAYREYYDNDYEDDYEDEYNYGYRSYRSNYHMIKTTHEISAEAKVAAMEKWAERFTQSEFDKQYEKLPVRLQRYFEESDGESGEESGEESDGESGEMEDGESDGESGEEADEESGEESDGDCGEDDEEESGEDSEEESDGDSGKESDGESGEDSDGKSGEDDLDVD